MSTRRINLLKVISLQTLPYLVVALVVAISIHEAAHALVAYKLGDPTAKLQGRLTLNPLAHLDIVGTIMLFFVGFGWGKPVPVNPYHFKNPVKDQALVSFAGPLSNFLAALLFSVPLNYLGDSMPSWLFIGFTAIVDLNIILGIFNLLPFPPLDGSKIFAIFIPKKYHVRYFEVLRQSQVGFLIFILADIFFIRNYLGFSIVWFVIGGIMDAFKILIFLGS